MSARMTLDALPPKYAAQAQAQMYAKPLSDLQPYQEAKLRELGISPAPPAKSPKKAVSGAVRAKPTMRQNRGGMNKTEQAFYEHLKTTLPEFRIYAQSFTLKIANGCRYTPDFVLIGDDGRLHAYETKGFMRDDAAVKIKVAASLYPAIQFTLVHRKKGAWHMEAVLP